jgi:hypothetical protein
VLDHIECKTIKPAETPNRNPEQQRGFQLGMLDEKERRRQQPDDQE